MRSVIEKNLNIISERGIEDFCKKWNVSELAFFGSVLGDDFTPSSDVDVLISFVPNCAPGLVGFNNMARELEQLFGRRVDLITRKAVERSPNHIRKSSILSSAEVFYAA